MNEISVIGRECTIASYRNTNGDEKILLDLNLNSQS